MDDIRKLLGMRIKWQRTDPGYFFSEVDGLKCYLRMNDFPDEPLYTLSYQGIQFSFDNTPVLWELPPFKET